jgi:hypothetical protein
MLLPPLSVTRMLVPECSLLLSVPSFCQSPGDQGPQAGDSKDPLKTSFWVPARRDGLRPGVPMDIFNNRLHSWCLYFFNTMCWYFFNTMGKQVLAVTCENGSFSVWGWEGGQCIRSFSV